MINMLWNIIATIGVVSLARYDLNTHSNVGFFELFVFVSWVIIILWRVWAHE